MARSSDEDYEIGAGEWVLGAGATLAALAGLVVAVTGTIVLSASRESEFLPNSSCKRERRGAIELAAGATLWRRTPYRTRRRPGFGKQRVDVRRPAP